MSIIFTCFLISISLSMDAFSLALIYGTWGISFKNQIVLSGVVGLFHFFMPLVGLWVGSSIVNNFIFDTDFVVGVIFGIIGFSMILSFREEKEVNLLNSIWGYLLFGFTVSVDSLTTGIGLSIITKNYIMAVCMFMVSSGIFTFLGLRFGNKLNQNFGKYACFSGGVMMIILGIYYIFRI